MFTVLSNLISAALISAATLGNPTNPKALSFDASAFVTVKNQIRLSVSKPTTDRLTVTLRDGQKNVLFHQTLPKGQEKVAILFTVNDLEDGQYEMEVSSNEGSIRKQITMTTPRQSPTRVVAMQGE